MIKPRGLFTCEQFERIVQKLTNDAYAHAESTIVYLRRMLDDED
jgi:hypothetical protein